MKKQLLIIGFSLLFIFAFVALKVKAQEDPETQVKKYNVTFPVADLGNCASFSECKTYCDDSTHLDACISFAKKKGFYKETETDTKSRAMLQSAKTELGCTSEESCKAVCSQESNFEKCSNFAKKNGLEQRVQNPGDKKILEKAKELLGCDSPSSCKATCEQESNRDKCSQFAKQTGLGGGVHRVGPGGCDSEESCRSYCEKNPDECRKFGGEHPSSPDKRQKQELGGTDDKKMNRKGPGGCDSEESCKAYCQAHPQECSGGAGQPQEIRKENERPESKPEFNQKEIIKQTSNSREDYCKTHPDECNKFQGGSPPQQISPPQENRFFQPPQQLNQQSQQNIQNIQKRGEPIKQEERRPEEPRQEVKGVSTTFPFIQYILNFIFGQK